VVVLRPATRNGDGDWSGLFRSAFRKSRNAMALVDHSRVLVDVNGAFLRIVGQQRDKVIGRPVAGFVAGAPRFTPAEWRAAPATGQFAGADELVCADGSRVSSGTPAPRS
jgi:PAS domain-containing protein